MFQDATPGETLDHLADIWNVTRNSDEYASILTNDYHFYFVPGDVGKQLKDGYIIPPSWNKVEDVQATANMFAQPSQGGPYDISMDIMNSWEYYYDPGGTEFTVDPVTLQLCIWPEGPDFAYYATGSCAIDFKKVDGLWRISGWHDGIADDGSTSLTGDQDKGGILGMGRAYYHP